MSSRRRGRRAVGEESLLLPQAAAGTALRATMHAHLEHLAIKQYAESSVRSRADSLLLFAKWCDEREVRSPEEVTKPMLERYQRHLFLHRKKNGRPLGTGSQANRLMAIRGYFKWLARTNQLHSNPASELESPRRGRMLPREVLSANEVEQVIAAADVKADAGIRDRAMMETLYSTGMRRMELVSLSVFAVNVEGGTVFIKEGKGRKDRVIPIGERALLWVQKYLDEVRPKLVTPPDEAVLFLTDAGERFHPNRLTALMRDYVQASGVNKRGACHLFRHAMATQMLENGADVRFVQEMLGHASLETTQIYTRVSIRKLKEIHAATHPGAKLQHAAPVVLVDEVRSAELLSSLAAEADDEDDEPAT